MPDTTTCAPIRASPICCAALDWEVDRPQPPSRLVAQHVVGRDGTVQSLESQLTHRFELEEIVGGGEHALGDQNLPGLGLTTQSRSEEHTSELQSQSNLVCRLLLEKKKEDLATSLGAQATPAEGLLVCET